MDLTGIERRRWRVEGEPRDLCFSLGAGSKPPVAASPRPEPRSKAFPSRLPTRTSTPGLAYTSTKNSAWFGAAALDSFDVSILGVRVSLDDSDSSAAAGGIIPHDCNRRPGYCGLVFTNSGWGSSSIEDIYDTSGISERTTGPMGLVTSTPPRLQHLEWLAIQMRFIRRATKIIDNRQLYKT
ncbi:hypothetical protein C8R44DRAFT_852809, partial [Mycena epipterygia]